MAEQMKQNKAGEMTAKQAIPAGYKQTEVGVIPEDWLVEPLENFTSFISYGFTNPMPTTASGPYMVTARDISNGKIQYDSARTTDWSAFHKLLTAKSKPQLDDVLLTKDGTLGRVALVENESICINQSVAILRPNKRIFPNFFKCLLDAPLYQAKMLEDAGGSTIKHIYITIVNKMVLGLPANLTEQTAIANVLSDSDALIDALEQLIAKKQAIKTAAMQQLLTGRTRLPAFALRPDGTPKGYKTSELGQIPEDWFVVAMNQLIEKNSKITYGVIQPGKNDPAGVLFVRGGDIFDGIVNVGALRKISPSISMSYKKTILQGGELIISLVGYPGECAIVPKSLAGANIARQVALVRFSSTEVGLHHFICHFLRSPFGKKILLKETFGSAQQVINLKDVNRLELSIPSSHQEQTAIATILSDMDNELTALEQKLAKARDLKQGMMQQLLTGRIRLPLPKEA